MENKIKSLTITHGLLDSLQTEIFLEEPSEILDMVNYCLNNEITVFVENIDGSQRHKLVRGKQGISLEEIR
ncbi:MAG: hypothetical protein WD512_00430 [Candidatus Paceibacterota bacterium]